MQLWPELHTPVLRIDPDKMERNSQEMAVRAKEHGVKLRPHIKKYQQDVAQLPGA